MNLARRSYQKELLDEEFIPFADIRQNMQELDFINTWLGGHSITTEAFGQLAGSRKEVSVCEIGCGGGDNLAAISRWCSKRNIKLSITGIDIKKECTDYAASRTCLPTSVRWVTSDYRKVKFEIKPDIIFSSLFCHHFTDEQLVSQLSWMKANSRIGFFINDLERNIVAYYSISYLTRLFSKSYLVKNDAPLSVARGFKKNELQNICNQANASNAAIMWKWAFRYLVVYKHD